MNRNVVDGLAFMLIMSNGCGGTTAGKPRVEAGSDAEPASTDGGANANEASTDIGTDGNQGSADSGTAADAPVATSDATCSADTQTDPRNCGACGHDCLGGGCEAGRCQPVVLATVPEGVISFAIDSTSVYWANLTGADSGFPLDSGVVSKCPLTGCTGEPTVLATQQSWPEELVVKGPNLTWFVFPSGTIVRCGVDCADDATTVATAFAYGMPPYEPFRSFTASETDTFFLDVAEDAIDECPAIGCATPLSVVTTLPVIPEDIIVAGQNLYWSYSVPGHLLKTFLVIDAGVMTCPLDDCDGGPTLLASGVVHPVDLVASAGVLYWIQGGNSVVACNVSGCGGAPALIASVPSLIDGLTVDQANVVIGAENQSSWEISSCPISGCSDASTLLSSTPMGSPAGNSFAKTIALDATHVYFVSGDGTQILALAR